MKVVINSCFGGFGLSDAAFEEFLTRKGIAWEKQDDKYGYGMNHYKAGHLGDDEHYLGSFDMVNDRADPDLVAVVEQLGKEANSKYSELKIVDIPDDVKWFIVEYDGLEHVAEEHRTWE